VKKKQKKYEANKMNIDGIYFRKRLGGFSSNLELNMPLPKRVCMVKSVCSAGTNPRKCRLLLPVDYTSVCHPLRSFLLSVCLENP